ncbi:tetratricopeptide repeat protein [Photobacterium damselae]|uniref:tetratricopeptide repeat protein n=1 Tax=Photobacterium damselae TaxID=38293 RepID=UPI0030811FE1
MVIVTKKHLIDSLPKHDSKTYFLRNDEEDIIKKLESNKFLQIYGPSGIGKSELSKSIASKMLGSFDDLIWVNGDYVNNRDFDFSSVYVSTYNSKVNVAASLENKKILLILDNFNDNALKIYREFISLNKKDSLCLMTSLQRNIPNNNTHSLSKLPYEISMSILQDTDIKPSCDIANKIIDYVDGYPLVLSVIRDSIEIDDISWEDTLSDIQSVVAKEDPDINTKIATRIIQRSQSQIDNELKWIYFLKSRFVSKEFLSAAIGTGVSNLKKRSIVTDSNSSFFTIHQMVLDSICYLYDDELINHEFIYDKLSGYIKVQNELKSVGYYNFLFMHDDFINLIYKKVDDNNELKMQLAYAMIQGRDQNKNCTWLKEIKKFELDVNSKISVLLFIERVEIELFEKGKENDNDSYKQLCDSKISDLESIISENSDADIDIYLKHHLGKLYVRSGNYEQAVKLFRYVIEKDSNADYARLQLARLSIWNNCALVKKQEVDECLEFILNRDTSWKELSLSVLLATYCLISERKAAKYRNKYIDSKIETFVSDLKYSLSSGFELPFELLSKLSSHLSYNHKEIYAEICEDLPLPSTIEENDKIKYSFATIQLAYYKHLKYNYNEPDKDVKKKECLIWQKVTLKVLI